jgi:hypothetical protein
MSVATSAVTPGTVPAWAVVFRDEQSQQKRVIGSDTYNGSVSATLPIGLNGGSYEVVIEGMSSEDYAWLRRPTGASLSADLHLWWKDAPSGVLGGLARFTGLDNPLGALTLEPPGHSLVATIRVDRVSRRPGPRRIEVVASGRELVLAQLTERRVAGSCITTFEKAVHEVAERVPVRGYGLDSARPVPGGPDFVAVPSGTADQALAAVIGQLQTALGLYSQPVAMIRDGVLHLGAWTPPPARQDDPGPAITSRLDVERSLDDDSGLLSIERGADTPRDTRLPDGVFGPRPPRRTFSVVSLGRPDLKPGDTVSLVLPPEDFTVVEPPSIGATLLTSVPSLAFGVIDENPPPTLCRVLEVSHKLSREQGFITTFRSVVLDPVDNGWDRPGPGPVRPAAAPRTVGVSFPDSAHGVASTVGAVFDDKVARALAGTRSRPGVIHDHAGAAAGARNSSEVWAADVASDGRAGTAQRAPVTAAVHAELREVPYATPFAWGSFGLVLPRYPGTRVVLANVGTDAGDFVDVGALWPRDGGPQAQPGDYWLALPVGIAEREHLSDPEHQLPDDGPATHDLVDGDGTRVIETSRFVLRITDRLTAVPNRPVAGDDLGPGSVLIESRSTQGGTSARIVLKDDGSITVTGTSITFDTQGQGDIELKASNVNVTLAGGTMDVS